MGGTRPHSFKETQRDYIIHLEAKVLHLENQVDYLSKRVYFLESDAATAQTSQIATPSKTSSSFPALIPANQVHDLSTVAPQTGPITFPVTNSPPTTILWQRRLNKFLNSIPTFHQWPKERKDVGLTSFNTNNWAISVLLDLPDVGASPGQWKPFQGTIDGEESLLKLVETYDAQTTRLRKSTKLAEALCQYRDVLLDLLCDFLIREGVPTHKIDDSMKKRRGSSSSKTMRAYRSAAVWLFNLMVQLYSTAWDMRCFEIPLYAKYLASCVHVADYKQLSLPRACEFLEEAAYAQPVTQIDGAIPFAIPCMIRKILHGRYSMDQICKGMKCENLTEDMSKTWDHFFQNLGPSTPRVCSRGTVSGIQPPAMRDGNQTVPTLSLGTLAMQMEGNFVQVEGDMSGHTTLSQGFMEGDHRNWSFTESQVYSAPPVYQSPQVDQEMWDLYFNEFA